MPPEQPPTPEPPEPREHDEPIRVGISACLTGQQVRYDGGHKRDAFLTETLARFVEFVPVCPEVDIGLGTPRETIRLARSGDDIRLVAPKTGADHTRTMRRYARRKARALAELDLAGYVFKKDSPSCGVFRVRVYGESGMPRKDGRGMFAAAITEHLPHLPVEEEGRLRDPGLRENFVERLFGYQRLRALFRGRWRARDVVAFHAREKLLLLAHDPRGYRELGRLVARVGDTPRAEFQQNYRDQFSQAMAKPATRAKHTNALQHMAGYFKNRLDGAGRAELTELIDRYRRGLIPLIVPVTLIAHHVRTHEVDYLAGQTYLFSHPVELMLRNHV